MNRMHKVTAQLAVLGLALALPISGWAQRGGQDSKSVSLSKVVRLGRAPVSKEILKVELPRPVEFKLSNGLTVLVMEDHRFPTISISLRVEGAGGLFQSEDNLAVAPAMAALMRTGTPTRTSKQIAEEQDRLGMTLGGGSGLTSTSARLSASGLSDNFDEWFALVTDVLLNPTFTEDEIKKYVSRQKAQLRQFESLPFLISIKWFNKRVYGDHRLHRIFPSGEELDAVTSESLASWHRERLTPQNAILGVVGDVDPEALIQKLEQAWGGWKKTSLEVELPEGPEINEKKQIVVIHRPGSVQTSLRMGNLAIHRTHPDYYVARVLSRVLGGGPASRLFLNLREEKGFTYGASASMGGGRFLSPWSASSDVRTEVTQGAMEQFYWEFYRIRNQPVPEDELEEAKRAIVARFALQLENANSAINNEITRRVYGFPESYWDDYPARIMEVTAGDVQRVGREHLSLDNIQIVAVGDAPQIIEVLESYGPIDLYDVDGETLDPAELVSAEDDPDAQGEPADVAGNWVLSMTNPRGATESIKLSLVQNGEELTGTIQGPGGGDNPVTGTVKGKTVKFSMTREGPRGEMTIAYSGKVDGDSMTGQMQMMSFSMDWTAKRAE